MPEGNLVSLEDRSCVVAKELPLVLSSYDSLMAFLNRIPSLPGEDPSVKLTLDEILDASRVPGAINLFSETDSPDLDRTKLAFRSLRAEDRLRALLIENEACEPLYNRILLTARKHTQAYFLALLNHEQLEELKYHFITEPSKYGAHSNLETLVDAFLNSSLPEYLVEPRMKASSVKFPGLTACVCTPFLDPSKRVNARKQLLDCLALRFPFIDEKITVNLTIVGSANLLQSALIIEMLLTRGYQVEVDLLELRYCDVNFHRYALSELRLLQHYFKCQLSWIDSPDVLLTEFQALIEHSLVDKNPNLVIRLGGDINSDAISERYKKEATPRVVVAVDVVDIETTDESPKPIQLFQRLSEVLPVGSTRYIVNKTISYPGSEYILSVMMWIHQKTEHTWACAVPLKYRGTHQIMIRPPLKPGIRRTQATDKDSRALTHREVDAVLSTYHRLGSIFELGISTKQLVLHQHTPACPPDKASITQSLPSQVHKRVRM